MAQRAACPTRSRLQSRSLGPDTEPCCPRSVECLLEFPLCPSPDFVSKKERNCRSKRKNGPPVSNIKCFHQIFNSRENKYQPLRACFPADSRAHRSHCTWSRPRGGSERRGEPLQGHSGPPCLHSSGRPSAAAPAACSPWARQDTRHPSPFPCCSSPPSSPLPSVWSIPASVCLGSCPLASGRSLPCVSPLHRVAPGFPPAHLRVGAGSPPFCLCGRLSVSLKAALVQSPSPPPDAAVTWCPFPHPPPPPQGSPPQLPQGLIQPAASYSSA